MLRKLDAAVGYVEQVALTICLATLILIGVYEAVKRNFFPPCPFWADELIRYSVFFIGLIGGALAAQSNRLFNIDMMTRVFSARGKTIVRIITASFTIWVCWHLYRGSMELRKVIMDEKGELLRPSTGLLSLPIAAGLIAFHLGVRSVTDFLYLVAGKVPPEFAPGAVTDLSQKVH